MQNTIERPFDHCTNSQLSIVITARLLLTVAPNQLRLALSDFFSGTCF